MDKEMGRALGRAIHQQPEGLAPWGALCDWLDETNHRQADICRCIFTWLQNGPKYTFRFHHQSTRTYRHWYGWEPIHNPLYCNYWIEHFLVINMPYSEGEVRRRAQQHLPPYDLYAHVHVDTEGSMSAWKTEVADLPHPDTVKPQSWTTRLFKKLDW